MGNVLPKLNKVDTNKPRIANGTDTATIEADAPITDEVLLSKSLTDNSSNFKRKNSVEIANEKMIADSKNDGFVPTTYTKSNGIISYDNKRIEQLSSQKGKVDGKDSFEEFIKEIKNNKPGEETRFYFGTISDELADDIFANTGLDLEGFNIAVRGDEIRHAYNNHGNVNAEAARGHIAVTDEMLEKLPSVFNKPDSIKVSPKKDYAGRTAIQIEKRIDGHVVTVNGISNGKHNLELDTIRIYPTETKKYPPPIR